jgi:hypothetical protein
MSSMRSLFALSLMHLYVTTTTKTRTTSWYPTDWNNKASLAKLETLMSRHATITFHLRIEREIKILYLDCKGKSGISYGLIVGFS